MSPRPASSPPRPHADSFAKPKPRPPKSPAQSAQIRVQNRRREYLERHEDYFGSMDHELADPLLYDTLVRRFQSPAEREAEGRKKGYGRILEGSLARNEERARQARVEGAGSSSSSSGAPIAATTTPRVSLAAPEGISPESASRAPGFALETELSAPAATRDEGRERWRAFLRDRFVHGGDDEFDYPPVDENDEYDVLEKKDLEDAWFDDEDPGWATDATDDGRRSSEAPGASAGGLRDRDRSDEDQDMEGATRERPKSPVDKILQGETGIQDF